VVRQAVVAHGGTIHAEPAPGGGAVFVVDLPHPSEHQQPA
jgi:signal transduction histidine kinase